MARYLAYRIIEGVYTYGYVISKRPDLKVQIDNVLIELNKGDLIVH